MASRGSHRTREPETPGHQLGRTDHRWAWRRAIRADPRKARVYRVLIAVVGLLLILLGAVTGPLPGPGGIPLVLLGLAVWASEFEWAHRLMHRFKVQLHKVRGWRLGTKVLAGAVLLVALVGIGYADVALLGVPSWLPESAADWLGHVPGVSR